jgi:hypothetical protein
MFTSKRIGLLQEINFPQIIFLASNIGICPLGVLVDFSNKEKLKRVLFNCRLAKPLGCKVDCIGLDFQVGNDNFAFILPRQSGY